MTFVENRAEPSSRVVNLLIQLWPLTCSHLNYLAQYEFTSAIMHCGTGSFFSLCVGIRLVGFMENS
jgi:hypothetical protein